ncbi:MAG: class I SAM-dependent methyltransferase [Actinomycetota bacterium]|nr:class I SAM-dependent methyltransferase [Actinomycetota bacterium]
MTTTTLSDIKQQHRGMWAAGRYADVAEHVGTVPPEHLLRTVAIDSGHAVLDVATGTGNVALRAARLSPDVTGLDLVPSLLDIARSRAQAAGADVHWVEGDAEALPFGDASFDRVLSVFGVQFAPRHELVAAELQRVCRPGGEIGLVNWTPEGLIGRLFRILGAYSPPPPEGSSPPPKWGDEEHVRSLFSGREVSFERGTNPFVFPTIEEYMTFFEERYGPTLKAKERLTADGRWEDCRAEMRELYEELNVATDGTLHIESEYLVSVIRR